MRDAIVSAYVTQSQAQGRYGVACPEWHLIRCGGPPIAVLRLQCFADESGTQPPSKHCLVAGYVGQPIVWGGFRQAWAKALEDFGIPSFHSLEFFRGKPGGRRRPPYEGWTDQQATDFLDHLLSIICVHNIAHIGTAICLDMFNNLTPGERNALTGGVFRNRGWVIPGRPRQPYFLGFHALVAVAANMMSGERRVDFVFDQIDSIEGGAVLAFNNIKRVWGEKSGLILGSVTFERDDDEPALQAADLLAYCWRQKIAQGDALKGLKRRAMEALVRQSGVLEEVDGPRLDSMLRRAFAPDTLAEIRAWQPKKSKRSRLASG